MFVTLMENKTGSAGQFSRVQASIFKYTQKFIQRFGFYFSLLQVNNWTRIEKWQTQELNLIKQLLEDLKFSFFLNQELHFKKKNEIRSIPI
jgi:hypothetical protein